MASRQMNGGGVALLLALGAVALSGLSALAQQPPASPQLSLLTVSLLYTENEELQDELNLSEEQVKKLSEHRTKWFSDYWSVPFGRGRRGAPQERAGEEGGSQANDKALADILKPEQLKRLRELTLQALEKQYGGRALRYAEVAEQLQLSEEQRTQARTKAPEAVLSREQQAKWQAMKGDAFKGALQANVPSPTNRGFSRGVEVLPVPRAAQYLFSKSVQAELKLTDEQRSHVGRLRERWRAVAATNLAAAGKEQAAEEIEGAAAEFLEPQQKARLEQIATQQELHFQPEDAVFALPQVVSALKLSAEQQKKIAALRQERRKGYRAVFLTGEGSDEIAKKAEAFKKETSAQLASVLSEEQRARLKGVVGEPFKGPIISIGRARQPRPTPLVIAGLPFVEDEALHSELKLSEEQVKKLAEEHRKYRALTPGEESYRTTQKAVGDILSAEQLKRFKQLTLQQAPAIAGYTDVAADLKLSFTQKEELADGEPPDMVLTGDQQAKLKELLGEPFKGTLTPSLPAGIRPLQLRPSAALFSPAVRCLEAPSVQDELKLSEAQRKKVEELAPLWRAATNNLSLPQGLGDAGEQYRAKLAEAMKVIDTAVADLLKPEQERRLRQIILQQLPKGIPGAALAAPGVADKLSLTAGQLRQIEAIKENDTQVRALIRNDNSLSDRRPGRTTLGGPLAMLNALTRVTDDKLVGLLTEDQKAKLKELMGEPFNGDLTPRFGGRGFGTGALGGSSSPVGGRPGLPSFAPPP
jgi:hypothetical protein